MMIDETSSAQQNRNLGVRIWQPLINGVYQNGGGRLIEKKERKKKEKRRKRKRGWEWRKKGGRHKSKRKENCGK